MANKASVDFGNCTTVIAVWDEQRQKADALTIPEFSPPGSFLIPSLIAYENDGRFFIGSQIEKKASPESREFRWMKRYIGLRSPYSLRVGERRIDARQAAEDFLHTLTAAVFSESSERPDELILSIPVESFEHYSDWLLNDMKRFEDIHLRLIDEASAAAAGYGLSLHPGDTLLVIDFGGSTLQAVCVSVSEEGTKQGRCCSVLGKAGCTLGGMTIDRWIYEASLKRLELCENDPQVHHNSAELLRYCEAVKKELSENESVVFDFFRSHSFLMTRSDLDRIFHENGLYETLNMILEETLRSAEDHGLRREDLTAVVPVGGSSLNPLIREYLTQRFSPEKLVLGEPLGAVARGAAVIAGGMHIYDFIQHSYAIRYVDSSSGEYAFRTIIPKGTEYPEKQIGPVMKLKASFDGQEHFGIAIYELKETSVRPVTQNEIFFDSDGAVHIMPLTESEYQNEQRFWMNERNPLFLNTEPGTAIKSRPCFEVTFGIDRNKMLTITALDLKKNRIVLDAYPVLRLV